MNAILAGILAALSTIFVASVILFVAYLLGVYGIILLVVFAVAITYVLYWTCSWTYEQLKELKYDDLPK